MPQTKVLQVNNLVTAFRINKQEYPVLNGISFDVAQNETLCVVGESGCGKSVMTLSVMQLLPANGSVKSGSIKLDGQELLGLRENEMGQIRGNKMGMIFQEPMTCLNPLLTIGYQMTEGLRRHDKGLSKKEAEAAALSYLNQVGVSNPEARLRQYPFQLSGGLRQRVMIAMMMSMRPRLLIADEPTTALDVTIQKQVLLLLAKLKRTMNAGILFITHDLGVVAEIADRVIVLYAGRKVEEGTVRQIFENPQHPYTRGLMAAVPNIAEDTFEIRPIPGSLPNIMEPVGGCSFHPRCKEAIARCKSVIPPLIETSPGHMAACHLVGGQTA
ncbi:MAG: ABC transporter ATP-binding protein [Christensenellales bacterium]|jgi:oligopeptide/dipeptide ABC transporter ATP-binding protein|nr:ABC transporter ATP-binding protein [Clostridiales bacterium]